MSEKLTCITLKGSAFKGLSDWGVHDIPDMIKQARGYAAYLRAQAEAVETAADEDFHVKIIRGPYARHHIKTLQEGK